MKGATFTAREILLWSFFRVSDISSSRAHENVVFAKWIFLKQRGVGLWLQNLVLHKLNFILDPLLQNEFEDPPKTNWVDTPINLGMRNLRHPPQCNRTSSFFPGEKIASQSEVDREAPRNPWGNLKKNRSGKVGISQVVSLHQNLTNSFLHWTLFPIWWLISYLPINSWIHLESRQNLGPEHEQF